MEELLNKFIQYMTNEEYEDEMEWCNIFLGECNDIMDHLTFMTKKGLLIDDVQSYSNFKNQKDIRQINMPYISFHIKRGHLEKLKDDLLKNNKKIIIHVCDFRDRSSSIYHKKIKFSESIRLSRKFIDNELVDYRPSPKTMYLRYWDILSFFDPKIKSILIKDYIHVEIYMDDYSNDLFNLILKFI